MNNELGEFLKSRRARIRPEDVGFRSGRGRRVEGLRREEVAALASVSVDYVKRLETGKIRPSDAVLESLARALQLDDAERAHLLRLAHEADGSNRILRPPRAQEWRVRPSLQWTLDAITSAPAIVGNDRLDFLAANHLGRAMYADLLLDPTAKPNFARYTFFDNSARRFYPDWDLAADMTVANLRTAAGKDPHDKQLHELVGELSTRSEEFRRRWHAHDVRTHGTGVKHFRHHVVGDLELAYESLDLRAEPGLTLTVYSAEPSSPTAHALPARLLGRDREPGHHHRRGRSGPIVNR